MKRMNDLLTLLLIAVISGALVFSGCKKDDGGDAPELPPMESLLMDFSDFDDPSDTLSTKKEQVSYYNWGVAFLNVAFWNAYITVGLAIPVASYAEALRQTPVYLGDNQWEWNYSVTVNAQTYTAKLQAERISNEEFTATMYISGSGAFAFNDFKWFEGTVRYDHTHALWTLYESPLNPVELLSVEWNRDWEAGTGDITYTVTKTGITETGSYISFAIDPAWTYDAVYTISLSTHIALIEWSRQTRAGRVKCTAWDNEWHCWNEFLPDIECP